MKRQTLIHNAAVAAALLGLLAATSILYTLNLGALGTALGLIIASLKALLIALIFMELLRSKPLTALFAAAGLYWLAILITLTLADILARS
jgi:cytochrome c oxidase subunit 4